MTYYFNRTTTPCHLSLLIKKIRYNTNIYDNIAKYLIYKFKDNDELYEAVHTWFNRKMVKKTNVPHFYVNAYKLEDSKYGHISLWDTENITDLSYLFKGREEFNENLIRWNVKNVVNMDSMFDGCAEFNQNLELWNVSKLKNINNIFKGCNNLDKKYTRPFKEYYKNERLQCITIYLFLQKLAQYEIALYDKIKIQVIYKFKNNDELHEGVKSWFTRKLIKCDLQITTIDTYVSQSTLSKYTYLITNKLIDIQITQNGETSSYIEPNYNKIRDFVFNKTINKNTDSEAYDYVLQFYHKYNYDNNKYGNISLWDTSNITNMSKLFKNKQVFNDDIRLWDVSRVNTMDRMFYGCHTFNQPLVKWDVSNVKNMESMFYGCHTFNQPLAKWDVSNVKNMKAMFYGCHTFNQPLAKWDVSNVKNMKELFYNCYNLTCNYYCHNLII
jgi:surface protein